MSEPISFTLNGQEVTLTADPGHPLVDVLREELGTSSVRLSCGVGLCGTCTVLLDGNAVSGCLLLVGMVAGRSLETTEGRADDDIRDAFVSCGAFQCSFCTPAMVLTTQAAVERGVRTENGLAHELAGNLCRCGSYPEIRDALARIASERGRR